eukprot:TRINITY_DN13787_c0_g1_i1.p2 TRINITY_DN13787_c0_g1~~TRINITY_DN13787_c0_g1_i1.p2  ORF type:complete len:159 (+),score=10.58 TRINITY_DN13787_c0_g1_i1:179-655(+)
MSVQLVERTCSSQQDVRDLLHAAEHDFRMSSFRRAFGACKTIATSETFLSLKDRRKHDVLKILIRSGHHNNSSKEVLRLLKEKKSNLGDYPLYVCEWVATELGNVNATRRGGWSFFLNECVDESASIWPTVLTLSDPTGNPRRGARVPSSVSLDVIAP